MVTGVELVGLHHPGLLHGWDAGVESEGGILLTSVNTLQKSGAGVFIDSEICLLERQQEKGGLLGLRPVCDDGSVEVIAYNW